MTNPYLHDSVERISRDPARKIGWDDRLIGTIRMALREGIAPRRYAFGAAATLDQSILNGDISAQALLAPLWKGTSPEEDAKEPVYNLVDDGLRKLRHWRTAAFPELEYYFRNS
jgi:mannitol-1-phosphate/altronate dehydrogenase